MSKSNTPQRSRNYDEEIPCLDDIHHDLLVIRRKILGVARLYSKSATDESGALDIDESSIGLGEIFTEISDKIDHLASAVSKHAVRVK